MRISDWSSDVCSSDLQVNALAVHGVDRGDELIGESVERGGAVRKLDIGVGKAGERAAGRDRDQPRIAERVERELDLAIGFGRAEQLWPHLVDKQRPVAVVQPDVDRAVGPYLRVDLHQPGQLGSASCWARGCKYG